MEREKSEEFWIFGLDESVGHAKKGERVLWEDKNFSFRYVDFSLSIKYLGGALRKYIFQWELNRVNCTGGA